MMVRAWLRSTPGVYEQYSGGLDLNVDSIEDTEEVLRVAVQKLRRRAFPNRGLDMWKLARVEGAE